MTEELWHTLLDRQPGDLHLREGFAIWLHDEADDLERAAFQRWLVREGKWPTHSPLNTAEVGWAWYWSREPITEPVAHATLPPWALRLLPASRWLYPTRREAEEVLFHAWKTVKVQGFLDSPGTIVSDEPRPLSDEPRPLSDEPRP